MTKAIEILREEIKQTIQEDIDNNKSYKEDRITKRGHTIQHNLIVKKIEGLNTAIATLNNWTILNK